MNGRIWFSALAMSRLFLTSLAQACYLRDNGDGTKTSTRKLIISALLVVCSSKTFSQEYCKNHLKDYESEMMQYVQTYRNDKNQKIRKEAQDTLAGIPSELNSIIQDGKELYELFKDQLTKVEQSQNWDVIQSGVRAAKEYGGFGEMPREKYRECMARQGIAESADRLSNNKQTRQAQNTNNEQRQQNGNRKNNIAALANECIEIDKSGSGNFGAFKNVCSHKVNFYTCNYKPKIKEGGFNWSADFDCEKNKYGLHTPNGGQTVAAHNRNTEMVYWFACKAPAGPVDAEFVVGKGIEARCH